MNTKIVPSPIADPGNVCIDKMSITYMQGADTCSDSDNIQFLTIESVMMPGKYPPEEKCPCYFNLRIDSLDENDKHWSFEDTQELINIIEDFKQRLTMNA